MKLSVGFLARLRETRGQSMAEYALVIAGVAILALFTGYQQVGKIVVTAVSTVSGL
jgi:Flp pilus assembly pilin Flp